MTPEDQVEPTLLHREPISAAGSDYAIEDKYDLSVTQLGMLIHGSDHASGTYIQQLVCSLREELNVEALEKAWQTVINRHTILRTSFHIVESPPFQSVHRAVKLAIVKEDWSTMPLNDQETSLATYLANDRQRTFEPSQAPLVRVAVFHMGHGHYEMVWTSHHALMDGRSRRLVLKELFSLYEAYSKANDLQLEHSRPYGEYIRWLQHYDLMGAEKFWRQELHGFRTPTSINICTNRGAKAEDKIGHESAETFLSESLTTRLREFAVTAEVTLNTLVQAAWSLLLSRYSGENDIVFGATRACRRSSVPDAESMIGLFINTLPVRVRISPDELVLPWLQRLRTSQIAVRPHEHTPLTKIIEWCEVPRGTPLFETIVVFENDQLNDAFGALGGDWKQRTFRLIEETNYALVLGAYGGKQLLLRLEYDKSRFDRPAIEPMLGHLTTLLEGMVDGAQVRMRDLPLLKATERQQLLHDWQGRKVEFARETCIHELFEQQAQRTPNATAVVLDNETLSYRELDARANQLAQYLRKLGVGPEVLVAICMERTPLMAIGLLGILKAGAAYVPLDPAYPTERLSFMLEDTAASVIITQQNLVSIIPGRKVKPICLDDWESIRQESADAPPLRSSAQNLAYVIYTSGSTGRPKGIGIQHRSVAALVNWASGVFSPPELQAVLASTSICFDLSVFELFVTLSLGGCVILADNALDLPRLKSAERVTLINTVPSAMGALLRSGAIPTSVKTVNLAGEPLKRDLVKQIYELGHVERVHDLYGPAEDTTYSTYSLRSASAAETIGRPISNTEIYLLSADLQLVPEGVSAEIYLSGEGLARGYLNRPELTAERFVPNPFNSNGCSRLYRTGDLARYLSDGNLEYLGRVDHQVKIRGYRIELEEIEATIERYSGILQCAVIASDGPLEDKKLIAYVVAEDSQTVEMTGLSDFLKTQLPAYMLPSQFVIINEMPLTTSGKIDRNALPDFHARPAGMPFDAPRNAKEEKLAAIWASILKLERVGIHDNFFNLGGQSLSAFKLISRVREQFNVELPLRLVFESPTVAGLSHWISEAEDGRSAESIPAIKTLPRRRKHVSDAETTLVQDKQREQISTD